MADCVSGDYCDTNSVCQPGVCGGFTIPNPVGTYADNHDGTVTDNVTGLVWEQPISAISLAQAGAISYCTGMGTGWRLPTVLELASLVDLTVAFPGPAINQVSFPGTPSALFWTSSPLAGGSPPNNAWYVDFSRGFANTSDTSRAFPVRCVR
jgi:hypothetical protein